jgi:hypothetical protein
MSNKIIFDDKKFMALPLNNGDTVWNDAINCGCLKGNFLNCSMETKPFDKQVGFSQPVEHDKMYPVYWNTFNYYTHDYEHIKKYYPKALEFRAAYPELVKIADKFENQLMHGMDKDIIKQEFVSELRKLDYIVFTSDTIKFPKVFNCSLEVEPVPT